MGSSTTGTNPCSVRASSLVQGLLFMILSRQIPVQINTRWRCGNSPEWAHLEAYSEASYKDSIWKEEGN